MSTIERPKKYSRDDEPYFEYLANLDGLWDGPTDLIFDFPVYVGAVNLARFLTFADLYRGVLDVAGDVADVGTYRGASMLSFAKLIATFEPHSATRVHGFDWFRGMSPGEHDDPNQDGKYVADPARLQRLIELQGLDGVCELHDLDLTTELGDFVADRPWLQFKLIFLDCGLEGVLASSMEHLWPRLVPGGALVLDHFDSDAAPAEAGIVRSSTGGAIVRRLPYTRSPTAYVIKPEGAAT